MKTNRIFTNLRKDQHLTQEELADKLFITRQAVSRWEKGETIPSIDTLMTMSKLFQVSINTLLGSPVELFCQACGMPLKQDDQIAKNADGGLNEKYCKWCVIDGAYVGPDNMEEMIKVCIPHMNMPEADARIFLQNQLPKLEHWLKHDPDANAAASRK